MALDPVLSRYRRAVKKHDEVTDRLLRSVQRLEELADGEHETADWIEGAAERRLQRDRRTERE